jgi:hypothetical protein
MNLFKLNKHLKLMVLLIINKNKNSFFFKLKYLIEQISIYFY